MNYLSIIRIYFIIVKKWVRAKVMVFNATFNNISVISWSILLVWETGVLEVNHRPAASH